MTHKSQHRPAPAARPGLSRLSSPRATWVTGLLLIIAFTSFGFVANAHLADGTQTPALTVVDAAHLVSEWVCDSALRLR